MPEKLKLQRDIHWLARIIRSDQGGLKSKATSTSDRALLKMQIEIRGERLKDLKQQLASRSA